VPIQVSAAAGAVVALNAVAATVVYIADVEVDSAATNVNAEWPSGLGRVAAQAGHAHSYDCGECDCDLFHFGAPCGGVKLGLGSMVCKYCIQHAKKVTRSQLACFPRETGHFRRIASSCPVSKRREFDIV